LLMIVTLCVTSVFAGVWIGIGGSQEFGGMGRTFLDARLTFGSLLSFDIADQVLLSNISPQYWDQLYTYVNLDIQLWFVELYGGYSPALYFYQGQFQMPDLMNHGYVHGGISFDFKPLRIYGETAYRLYYDPLSIGSVPIYSLGVQIGF
ncbi:MAG: hypothetical protein ACP5MB_10270, partial [bacterium]